jgi:ABC-type polysaccharide/polyol phosphate transport system ATPase subunit
MATLEFDNVSFTYPILNSASFSLRKKMLNISTGGFLFKDSSGLVNITALRDVNFRLSKGDAVGLKGHNGAGKSTLLRLMAGIYAPDKGMVLREGKVSTVIELGSGLDSELSGYENIYRMAMLLGMNKEAISEAIPNIESFTELGDFLNAPVRVYSSGMLMRLMFAVSTINNPEILLVDEMLSAGDSKFQEKAKRRMEEMISASSIFVFASHSDDLISRLCNRVFEIEHGLVRELS